MKRERERTNRDQWLHVRLTPSELDALRQRARLEGRKVSELARAAMQPMIGDLGQTTGQTAQAGAAR